MKRQLNTQRFAEIVNREESITLPLAEYKALIQKIDDAEQYQLQQTRLLLAQVAEALPYSCLPALTAWIKTNLH